MLHKLLVPIDASPLSEQAAWKAAAIARSANACMRLVHVYEPPFPAFDGGHVLDADFLASDRALHETYVRRVAGDVLRHYGCHTEIAMLAGAPAEAIETRAADEGADLIVMSTHGRTGINRAWFGSVADAVARRSPVPVLLVRMEDEKPAPPADSDPAFQRVLVALDGSTGAERVLACLMESRIPARADVKLLEIVNPVPLLVVGYPDATLMMSMSADLDATDQVVKHATAYLLGVAARLECEGARKVDTEVVVAPNTGPAIVELAKAWGADLVAISSHGRGATRLLLGSVADKILRGTHCSVLLARTAR